MGSLLGYLSNNIILQGLTSFFYSERLHKIFYTTKQQDAYTDVVLAVFRDNRNAYGTRRIKAACARLGIILSRRRIGRMMKENNLVSVYTVAQYKPTNSASNDATTENVLNREFNQRDPFEAIVSDLTYVRVGNKWHYARKLLDLRNRRRV